MAKRKRTSKTKKTAKSKSTASAKAQTAVTPEKVLAMINDLEELTGKVKDSESEIIRTKELQEDLNSNLATQLEEKESLDAKTKELTDERDALAKQCAGLESDIAGLEKEIAELNKSIEKAETLNSSLTEKKKKEESVKSDADALNKELNDGLKKTNVEIQKLTESRKSLTS